ncbi:MAG: hypothetical protein JW894_07090 [Bacteroidales bacterium]|nr:hypothetical protein [Bacteroidales bacterium]
MKNKFSLGFLTLVLTALLLASCSKVPQAEIDAANAAIEEAKTAGADIYVHEDYIALQDSLNAVMANIEAQKSKFIKNYSTLKDQLSGITAYAQEVKQKTETRKAELKTEIENTIAEVKTLVETNRQLILEAPKGKEGTSALVAIKDELNAVETSINEANSMLESGEYLTALDKAKAAKEKANSINAELTEVIAKYKANVKGKKS